MPKPKDEVAALVEDLAERLGRIVGAAILRGREQAIEELRSFLANGGKAPAPARAAKTRGKPEARKRKKPARRRKSAWDAMTAEQKQERIRKMLAGRGLKPKAK